MEYIMLITAINTFFYALLFLSNKFPTEGVRVLIIILCVSVVILGNIILIGMMIWDVYTRQKNISKRKKIRRNQLEKHQLKVPMLEDGEYDFHYNYRELDVSSEDVENLTMNQIWNELFSLKRFRRKTRFIKKKTRDINRKVSTIVKEVDEKRKTKRQTVDPNIKVHTKDPNTPIPVAIDFQLDDDSRVVDSPNIDFESPRKESSESEEIEAPKVEEKKIKSRIPKGKGKFKKGSVVGGTVTVIRDVKMEDIKIDYVPENNETQDDSEKRKSRFLAGVKKKKIEKVEQVEEKIIENPNESEKNRSRFVANIKAKPKKNLTELDVSNEKVEESIPIETSSTDIVGNELDVNQKEEVKEESIPDQSSPNE
jgi:hypothetical protein